MIGSRRRPPVNQRRPQRESWRQRLAGWWQQKTQPAEPSEDDDPDADEESGEPESGWWSWLIWGTAALCVGIVALAALNLRDFQTRIETGIASKFQVVGAKRVTEQQVMAASQVRWGAALTSIDRTAVSRAIEKLPWVRQAEVAAELPNKVTYVVTEYEPYALLLGEGKMMIVDKDGFVFKEAELGEAGDIPVITGFSGTLSRDAHVRSLGFDESAEQRRLRSVLKIIEAHGKSQLVERFPLSEVHWDPVLGTTLVSARDGAEVRLSKAHLADAARALGQVARVLDRADRDGRWLRYALMDDDRRPDRIVVRTEEPGAQGSLAGGAGGVGLPKEMTAIGEDPTSSAGDVQDD